MNKSGLSILLLLILVPTAFLRAQWFDSYAKGRDAVSKGRWQQAVTHLTEALSDEPDSKARKKTYSLQFIDYFPYLYRGIAYYKLGDMVKAKADLENADSKDAVAHANEDGDAPALLAEYLGYLQKSVAVVPEQKPPPIVQQKAPQQKQPQNPVPAIQQPDTKKLEAEADRKAKREKSEQAMAAGEAYFKSDDLEKAQEQFEIVIAAEPANRRAAGFLKQIENRKLKLAAAAAAPPKEPVPPAGETHPPAGTGVSADTAGSALFAEGISSFFQGDYRVAIERLGSSARNGNDNPRVYAILACSYAAEYLLDGSEDKNLRNEAVEAFGKAKAINPRFALDTKLISPGIIALLTGE